MTWLLRLVAIAWLVMSARFLPWSYYVAARILHGQYFAVGPWGRVVNFSTVLLGPIATLLLWRRREFLGAALLLFLAVDWLSYDLTQLWQMSDLRIVGADALLEDALCVVTIFVIGAKAVASAMAERAQ